MWEELFLNKSRIKEKVPTHASPSMSETGNNVTALYSYLENEITARLEKLPPVISDDSIKIGHISFAFDNKDMINLLVKRGALITKGNFKKLPDINAKIDKLL